MGRVRWTDEAVHWLREIRDYVARDNAEAAQRTVRGIYELGASLDRFPERGYRYREREVRDVRVLLYGHYRIAYLVKPGGDVDILGVFHGALDSIATSTDSTREHPGEHRRVEFELGIASARRQQPAKERSPRRASSLAASSLSSALEPTHDQGWVSQASRPIANNQRGEDMTVTAKEAVRLILEELPDDVTLEDIQYRIYVRQKIERGLEDIEAGRVVSHEEVERRMAKWHDATWDQVMYEIYVRQRIAEGQKAIADRRVVSHEEVKKRFSSR